MLFERQPLRALVPLSPSKQTGNEIHWPNWWKREEQARIVINQEVLLSVPLHISVATSPTGRTIASAAPFESGLLEQENWPPDQLRALPCLVADAKTIMCYAHPLNRGTFFYTEFQGYLLVSTSLHDLCRVLRTWEPDEEAVADYLFSSALLRTDLSKTLVAGIQQVPPGSCLIFQQGQLTKQAYWQPQRAASVHRLPMEEAVPMLREVLDRAVARAIGDAQTVGIFYSGGLDSSAIAGYALEYQRRRGGEVLLFSAGDEVATKSERILRHHFAQTYNCRHYEVPIDLRQSIFPLVRAANRVAPAPTSGLFATVNEALARQAIECHVEVMLTGEGGEEIFGENDFLLADLLLCGKWRASYHCLAFLTALSQNWQQSVVQSGMLPILTVTTGLQKHLLRLLTVRNRRPHQAMLKKALTPLYGERYVEQGESYQQREMNTLRNHFAQGWALADYQALLGVRDIPPFEPEFAYQDTFALPVASPLADPEVFQASLSLRLEERLRLGVGSQSKSLLRAAASPVVPPVVLRHPKINVADLTWRILHHHFDEVLSLLQSPWLARWQITPQVTEEDIIDYPDYGILRLLRLVVLVVWFEELQNDVEMAKEAE